MDAYGESPEQFATLAVPSTPGPHPVVVLIHGGFWRAAYGLDLMEPLAADLVDLSRVSVVGHSAGGHLALWAVAEPNLSGGARYAVVEGDADDIVPERFARPDRPGTHTSRVKFVLIPGADHFDVIDPGHEAWTAAVAELTL